MSKTNKANHLATFCKGLKLKKYFLLASHVSPEGDAVASLLAMDSLLRRMGKKTLIVCEDPFPERLNVLPSKRWNQTKDVKTNLPFDALLVADCPALDRIGKTVELLRPEMSVFNMDHHLTNRMFGDYNFVQPKAAACGEVVYDIFKYFRMPFTKEERTALYVALTTDTGSFKYGNTTVKAHRIVAGLIGNGLDVEKINDQLYATYSLRKIKLYGRLLGKVNTAYQGQIAWVGMTHEDLHHSGASYDDTEGFIDFLKYLREVKLAFFISETNTPNSIKVSLRSKGACDVSKIAASFGGGGHQKASGCTIQGTLDQVAETILREASRQLDGKRLHRSSKAMVT